MPLNLKSEIIKSINELKKEKNAVILAHCYQNLEVDEVADFVGDSLSLSQKAAETEADIIVFAGVYFMAETAKILSPHKKILLPRIESGCLMADMINVEDLREFKSKNPDSPVVCYVNSTAEIKAESDICCTSSNAVKIVQSLPDKKILFAPDRGLGTYVASQLPDKEIISYYGYCPTHMRILPEEIIALKKLHQQALTLVHPECHIEVIKLADYVGSTSGIMTYVSQSSSNSFIIGTEQGVTERLQRDFPEKKFISASPKAICENMKWHSLEDILHSLQNESYEISVEKNLLNRAHNAINQMMKVK